MRSEEVRGAGWLVAWTAVACAEGRVLDPDPPADTSAALAVEEVVVGLSSPVYLTSPPGDARLFVVEQPGRIQILREGELLVEPFLDITARVRSGGERGLLSLAFHPQYAANGLFYVNYTDLNGDTRVERYAVSADPDRADPSSAKLILAVEQPFANHNGGHVLFGTDGMLYIAMGDGGSGGDPLRHAQNLQTLLGALLRIDVDASDPYAIPADNPLAGDPDRRGELWAWGLRNPWRFAFDDPSQTLFVADVGQNRWEEINAVPIASASGRNFGWHLMEASHCFAIDPCDPEGLTLPVVEYATTSTSCSVIGGAVYRGVTIPEVVGHYFYSDFCGGFLRSFRLEEGVATAQTEWAIADVGQVTSFGVDADGEMYLLSQQGAVYKIRRPDAQTLRRTGSY